MTEPFLPRPLHAEDTIDAADPGAGAPGKAADDALEAQLDDQATGRLDEEIERFEARLDEERDAPSLFRTPTVEHPSDETVPDRSPS